MLRWHHCIPGPGTFFSRQVLEKLIGRDVQFRYVADFDFWLRAGLIGKFGRIPLTLATFRVHADSASIGQQGELMAEEHIQLVNKVYALSDLPLDVLAVRDEAFSSANFIAGCVCGPQSSTARKMYFRVALSSCPHKYLFEYRKRLSAILPEILDLPNRYVRIICLMLFDPVEFAKMARRKLSNA